MNCPVSRSLVCVGVFLCCFLAGCAASSPDVPQQTTPPAPRQQPIVFEPLTSPTPSPEPPQPATVAPVVTPVSQPREQQAPPVQRQAPVVQGTVSAGWNPLVTRLRTDVPEVAPATIEGFFAGIGEFSPAPMGVKIKELYTNKFLRTPKKPEDIPAPPPPSIYRGVVTQANKEKCQEFLSLHKAAFDVAEKTWSVPREVIVSLLLVETKLGTFLGKEMAFWSLASMAAADTVDKVKDHVPGITIKPDQVDWMQEKLNEKSAWAYKELKAFVRHCAANNLEPGSMQGSVYGAIGICQFMPSNLARYGADGDGDGRVDLFVPADAIASAAKYLAEHGWKTNTSFADRRNVLKKYNNLTRYANTILAMAESIRTGTLLTAAPDAATPAEKAATKPAAKPTAKPAPKKGQKK